MTFKWLPIYSVNVAEIDEQHKKMFDIINDIFSKTSDQEIFSEEILKDLDDYSLYHFKTEEDFFEKLAYPKKEEHQKMHQEYIDKMKEIKKNLKSDELKSFLEKWWIDHVQGADQEYSMFFNRNGLF